ncbi:hypothetical protein NKR23_g4452 [Pleurostoma richardsiae]|uniref:Phosphatidylinositol N-acetylglucosaminyltransferase subunit H conserved domain-containing protein n=1 Tax=Pleurostoma richardsiae TaxID=41990 RepID=A0AA38S4X6_9PEZI|nr:hypothetical protein NKR23_g4452 [Pleurostoma richardsiae]
MLTTAPYLRVRRPSPTTAEFIVTTCPPPTLPLRLLLFLVFLGRILLAISVALLLYSSWALSPFSTTTSGRSRLSTTNAADPPPSLFSSDFIWYALRAAHTSPAGQALHRLAAQTPAVVLLPACAAALWLTALRAHTTESLLVLRGLGIQTSSSGATYLGWAGTRFIPTEKIRDVLINEAFRGFEVRHYLVVVVEGEEELVVVFPRLLPRRRIVEAVWRGARACLYDPDGAKRVDEKG